VGPKLLEVVEESRLKGNENGILNVTFIVLIHKSDKPKSFLGFRPIYFCNLDYKVIFEIIASRIKYFLSKGTYKEQFGLLDDRKNLDAIRVAHETLHNIKTKKINSLVLKLDMMKAYDRVD